MSSKLFQPNTEEAILSILLNNPEMIYDENQLTIDMFSSAHNQILFKTMSHLSSSGIEPSPRIVKANLMASGNLETAGDNQYIDYLVDNKHNKNDFRELERIVINAYKAVKVTELAHQIEPLIKSAGGDIDSVISHIKENVDDLSFTGGENGTIKIGDYLSKAFDTIKGRVANPGLSGISTGFTNIDTFTGGMSKGELWVVASRPSLGKTSFICNSMMNTTGSHLEEPNRTLFFSLEMSYQSVVDRLLSIDSKVRLTDIKLGTLSDEDMEKIDDSMVKIKPIDLLIDTNFYSNPEYLVNKIKKYHRTRAINCVWIDYLQLLIDRDSNATNEIGKFSRSLKRLARDLDIPIGIVSQLNRLVEQRDDKRPILSDLRQSGNIEEDADVVAFLYRDDYYNPGTQHKNLVEFIVRKNRNGPTGKLFLQFDPNTTSMYNTNIGI